MENNLCCVINPHIKCSLCEAQVCKECIPYPNNGFIDKGIFFMSHPFENGGPTICKVKGMKLNGRWTIGNFYEMYEAV